MGSPLSPILANIFMQFFEELMLKMTDIRPLLWLRYVDDMFIVLLHSSESTPLSPVRQLHQTLHQLRHGGEERCFLRCFGHSRPTLHTSDIENPHILTVTYIINLTTPCSSRRESLRPSSTIPQPSVAHIFSVFLRPSLHSQGASA